MSVMTDPLTPLEDPTVSRLIELLRETAAREASTEAATLMLCAADVLTQLGLDLDLSLQLSSKADEEFFLARIDALLPQRLTPRQVALLMSFFLHRYEVPLSDTDAVLSEVRRFVWAQTMLVMHNPDNPTTH